MKLWRRTDLLLLRLCVVLAMVSRIAYGETLSEERLTKIKFDQKLNSQVSLELPFVDENAKPVHLGDYFGQRPVILALGYYECPMLCSLVLNGIVESLDDLKGDAGKKFDVVFVSINPHETPSLAVAKKRNYLKRYGRTGTENGWHFLTGKEEQIATLARQIGFNYAYDSSAHQYAHASGFVVLTPEGKVSKYFFGVSYSPVELNQALNDASSQKIGSPIDQFFLLCFHFNPITSKYGYLIITSVRVCGVLTVIGLASAIVLMVRREKRPVQVASAKSGDSVTTAANRRSAG